MTEPLKPLKDSEPALALRVEMAWAEVAPGHGRFEIRPALGDEGTVYLVVVAWTTTGPASASRVAPLGPFREASRDGAGLRRLLAEIRDDLEAKLEAQR